MQKPILYYVYDPMCSWCWGYRESWLTLSEALTSKGIEIRYQLGGLAPDSDIVMPLDLQHTLQNIWRKIQAQLGTEFNFDFWTKCQPQRSTYPSCRACLIARKEGKEKEMLFAIQQAYYLKAKNPSSIKVLSSLAETIGFDPDVFETKLVGSEVNQQLMEEIAASRQLPIQGFPSLVLSVNNKVVPIALNYSNWQQTYAQIDKIIETV